MKTAIFVGIMLIGFFVPAILFQQYWLAAVFGVFFLCFGVIEILAVRITGKSVSQKVWQLPMWKRVVLVVGMAIAWSSLLLHFLSIL